MAHKVGTASDVVAAFVEGHALRTPAAPVPGGCRVEAQTQPDGTTVLYSYRTQVAVRNADGSVAVTPRRYSVTTSKLMGHVRGACYRAGLVEHPELTQTVRASVPGRWGGFGPAWHATGYEDLPFVVWNADPAPEPEPIPARPSPEH